MQMRVQLYVCSFIYIFFLGGTLGNEYTRGTLGNRYIGGTLGNEYAGGTFGNEYTYTVSI